MNGFGSQNGSSLFGQQNSAQSTGGLFGNNPSSNVFGSGQQPASGSTFGAKRTQSVSGAFGSANTGSSNVFGSSGGPASSSGTGLFGQNTANSGAASSPFGAANTTSTGGGLFGKPAASTPTLGFGQNSQQGTPSGGLFGSSSSNQQSSGPFGSNNSNTGQQGGLFGNNTGSGQQSGSGGGLFGSTNNTSNQPGSLFGNNSANNSSQNNTLGNSTGNQFGGGLFGQSNQQNSTGTSFFGKPAPSTSAGSTGLFGGAKPTSTGLFGQTPTQSQQQAPSTPQPSSGLFGSSSSTAGGGLFGNTNKPSTTSGGLLGSNTGGGLTGTTSQPQLGSSGGGLFGNTGGALAGSKPAGSSGDAFGVQQQPAQQPLHATIDQASYILQGAQPSQKLYTSLTQPAQKRTAHEARAYSSYGPETHAKAPSRNPAFFSARASDTPKSSPMTIAGPSLLDAGIRPTATSAGPMRAEPRQWINSYDKFLKERPTTLIIQREERRIVALPSPPVSTAPPPIASIAAESSSHHLKLGRESTFTGDKSTTAAVEPDVSLFHRQANNMTVVQVNKKALEEGYYIFPRLETLSAMSKTQLAAVSNLVIGRENYGQIEYSSPVDLSRLGNLGDILGTLVIFEAGTVCVYPDEETKAHPGHELNLSCTVTIENAWPIDATTRKRITDMEDPRMLKHISRLREKCESDGGEFVTFAQGLWVFKVPHFSKWGIPAEEMIIDSDEDNILPVDREESPVVVVVDDNGEASTVPANMDGVETDDAGNDDMNDNDVDGEAAEDIQSWQDQLNHAAYSCYTASQEALVAAASLPSKQDLADVLLPVKEGESGKEATSAEQYRDSNERDSISQEVKSAFQGSLRLDTLRQHVVKTRRKDSSLPLLQSKFEVGALSRFSPLQRDLWSLLFTLYSSDGSSVDRLSHWLEYKVSDVPVSSKGNDLEAIWQLLTTHKLTEAVSLALKSNNPHLAVLISLFDHQIGSPSDAERQLSDWKNSRTLASIPLPIRRIWELASGAPPAAAGLTWVQWLGMRLWYSHTSVEDAVSKIPGALITGSGPELSLIRHAVGSKPLKAIIDDLSLVDSFLFLQALDSLAPLTAKQDLKCHDSVCSTLAKTLQGIGEGNTAVLVGLHTKDAKQCLDTVHNILVEASDSVSMSLTQELDVPEQLIDEARAAHSRNKQDYQSGAQYLIHAGLYEQAHQLIVAHVAPQAVLDGRVLAVEDLLVALESHKERLQKWNLSGGVYLQYIYALKAGDAVAQYDVKALSNSCRYANTPNLQSKAAISIIASWVASTTFVNSDDFGIDLVLNMKFDPSQMRLVALQQSARLMR